MKRCITGLKSGLARLGLTKAKAGSVALAGAVFMFSGQAQALDCAGLRNLISATPVTPPSALAEQYNASAARQRGEIEHMRSLMQSLHCDKQQFLFFSGPRPAQCDPLQTQLAQMEASLSQMERAAAMSNDGSRADMIARYRASCMDTSQQRVAPHNHNLLDTLFGNSSQPQSVPIQPDEVPIAQDPNFDEFQQPRGGSQAICVKTADGSFFPVSYAAIRRDINGLSELCRALCPAAEVRLFTWNPNGDLKNAVDAEGNSYSSLPNALKFETKYVPEASCKPADKSWAQVLGPAEYMLGQRVKGDILVTPQKAAELSRAKEPQTSTGKKKSAQPQMRAGPDPVDAFTANLAAATASNTVTSGIGGGGTSSGPLFKLTDGEVRQAPGPDGIIRTVRIVAPTL